MSKSELGSPGWQVSMEASLSMRDSTAALRVSGSTADMKYTIFNIASKIATG
jgi:hypothetical protein